MDKHEYLINGGKNSITPFDRGFSYGDGVFRTLKIKNGKPFFWELHYPKLEADCNALNIVCPSPDLLLADIYRLFSEDNGYAVAKIIITRGESERGYALPVLAQPTRIVIKSKFPIYPEVFFNDGVHLHLCKLRLSYQPLLAGIKHLNRLENVLARTEWTDHNIVDGILLDQEAYVIECTSSNIFARFGNTLMTPDLSHCGVSGVTRELILSKGKLLGLKTKVSRLKLDQLMQADELLICNSLFGVWQVTKFNGASWPIQTLAHECRDKLMLA